MTNRKKLYLLILIILLILLALFGFKYFQGSKDAAGGVGNLEEEYVYYDEDYEDFEEESIVHDLKLSIISPEEEVIFPGQARMYQALVEGNGKYKPAFVKCNWEFYINEYNEEVLYEGMETRGVLGEESQETCGFTSTFIDRVGTLRVVLSMTVYNALDDNLETVTAEREYVVRK